MGVGALAREARLLPRGEILPAVADPILLVAFDRVTGLYDSIAHDASINNERLDAWERGLRLNEGGMQARLVGAPEGPSEMRAFRLLASSAHYWDVQYEVSTRILPREELVPRVLFMSVFNKGIRGYADAEPQTYARELTSAMVDVRHMIGGVACSGNYEPLFRRPVRGARYERWGKCVVACAGPVKETETADDLKGEDLSWRVDKKKNKAIRIDIASSKRIVQNKCKTKRPQVWGVRNGVLVLWPGITEPEMGDTFETDDDMARTIYTRKIDGTTIRDILKEAKEDRRIKQVAWERD